MARTIPLLVGLIFLPTLLHAAQAAHTRPATAPVAWSGKTVVLEPAQSSGGILVTLSDGTRGVAMDKTCDRPWPHVPGIEWALAAPLPAGWWRGCVQFSAREGDDKGWVNHQLGIVLNSPNKPLANMMLNFRPPEKGAKDAKFEFWMYLSAPANGVKIQDVYAHLYNWKRTWPILRVTLEQRDRPALTSEDPVAMDLVVKQDGTVELPGVLPPGLWSLRAAMTREGSVRIKDEDGKTVTGEFSFDKWRRPAKIYWHAGAPIWGMSFKTSAMFRAVVLENSRIWPAPSLAADGRLIPTVDPTKTESATLELLGANLTGEAPALTTFPGGAKTAVVTTWDDGEQTDLRLAELFHRLGYRPTFFLNHNKPAVKELAKLEALNVEVGSHCWNHPFLYILPPQRAMEECIAMRQFLEEKLQHPVISFSYPNGYTPAYDTEGDYVLRAVRAAGYWSGRTTAAAAETVDSIAEPLALKTDGFFGDRKGLEKVWQETRAKEGGIFSFWGHSWQIGKTDAQWKEFEDFAATFARQPETWYAQQGELMLWIWARKNVKFEVTDKTPANVSVRVARPWLHPWLSARCPLTIKVPHGVEKVVWRGKGIEVKDHRAELPW